MVANNNNSTVLEYTTQVEYSGMFINKIRSLVTEVKPEAIRFCFFPFAQRWIVLAIHLRASQSECTDSATHLCGIFTLMIFQIIIDESQVDYRYCMTDKTTQKCIF